MVRTGRQFPTYADIKKKTTWSHLNFLFLEGILHVQRYIPYMLTTQVLGYHNTCCHQVKRLGCRQIPIFYRLRNFLLVKSAQVGRSRQMPTFTLSFLLQALNVAYWAGESLQISF